MGQVWGYELGLNDDMDQVWGYRDYELWMISIIIVMVYYSSIRGYECYMLWGLVVRSYNAKYPYELYDQE